MARSTRTLEWWQKLAGAGIDRAVAVSELVDLLGPRVKGVLLRREVETAADAVILSFNRRDSVDAAEHAADRTDRLRKTLTRLELNATNDNLGAAWQICKLLEGQYAQVALETERALGTFKTVRALVRALKVPHLDTNLTVRLLMAGHDPAAAVKAGQVAGRYAWCPGWLLETIEARALEQTLEEPFMQAVERLAYAKLNQIQARFAGQVLGGDAGAFATALQVLRAHGEHAQATALVGGDMRVIAVAARLSCGADTAGTRAGR